MNKTLLTALMLLAAPALAGKGEPCPHPEVPKEAEGKNENGWTLTRGAKIAAVSSTPVGDVVSKPSQFEGKDVVVEGKVRKACSAKGCWMELAASDKGPGMRVKFKDYAFFVPTDSAGSTARVQGTVKVATLSAEMTKHYEGEGATVPRAKDGTPQEVQMMATGVELKR